MWLSEESEGTVMRGQSKPSPRPQQCHGKSNIDCQRLHGDQPNQTVLYLRCGCHRSGAVTKATSNRVYFAGSVVFAPKQVLLNEILVRNLVVPVL